MLMMPCHFAINSKGALTGARSAVSQTDDNWCCHSCGCQLRLHSGNSDTPPWFEHEQSSANESALMYCQHRNHRDGLPGERFRVILYALHEQNTCVGAQSWFCVWCGSHYDGDKHCVVCNTGIYSIEEPDWRDNYISPIDEPAKSSPEKRHLADSAPGGI